MEELVPILLRIASALEHQNEIAERMVMQNEQWHEEQGAREEIHVRLRQAEINTLRLYNRAAVEGMAGQLQHTLSLIEKAYERSQEEEDRACGISS